uniref:Calmodulin-alpha-like n=1 Tax=Crassostrea virginica TaxID=6565 RepID=A0A8B8DRF2_CRAVI|nr:calmodulin-alpha-like [Crassostrea virginica]
MAENLTEEQLQEMKLIFNMFDTNANGVIDAGELERVLHAMNQNPTPEEMEEFLVELDPEETGEITFEAFLDYAPSKFRTEDEEMSMVREAFRVFDKDGSGYITLDEAKDILQRGENSISDEDLEDFFNQSDLDKDGRINYEEFAVVLNKRFSPD